MLRLPRGSARSTPATVCSRRQSKGSRHDAHRHGSVGAASALCGKGQKRGMTPGVCHAAEVMPATSSQGLQVDEERSGDDLHLKVTVPAQRCSEVHSKVLEHMRKTVTVPGYRNNDKASEQAIIRAAGGQDEFKNSVVEDLVEQTLQEAVAPYESSLLSGSLRVVSRGKELAQQFDTRRDLVYEVEAEIGEMGLRFTQDYKGLKIEVDAVLNQSREDFELERAILLARRENGGDLRVANRASRPGDTLIIDFKTVYRPELEPIPGLDREKHELDTLEPETFLPNVVPELMGLQVGETKSVDFEFPERWEPEHMAGRQATATIKIREVLAWKLPDLTLEMCRKMVKDADDIEDFRKKAREAIQTDASMELQSRIQSEVLRTLSMITECDRMPKSAFEEFARGRYESEMQEAIEKGVILKEDIEKYAEKEFVDDYVEMRRGTLEGEFRALLALDKVFSEQELEVDEELVKQQVDSLEQNAKAQGRAGHFKRETAETAIRNEATNLSTMAFLEANAEVTIKPLEDGADPNVEFGWQALKCADS